MRLRTRPYASVFVCVVLHAYVFDRTHFQRVGYFCGAVGRLRASWEVGDRAGSPTWRRPREAGAEQFGYRWVRQILREITASMAVASRHSANVPAGISQRPYTRAMATLIATDSDIDPTA